VGCLLPTASTKKHCTNTLFRTLPMALQAGLDSLGSVELRNALSARFSLEFPATAVFDYPSVAALAGFIARQLAAAGRQPEGDNLALPSDSEADLALTAEPFASSSVQPPDLTTDLVGVGCLYPGASPSPQAATSSAGGGWGGVELWHRGQSILPWLQGLLCTSQFLLPWHAYLHATAAASHLQAWAASGQLLRPASACSAPCRTSAGTQAGATRLMWRWDAATLALRPGQRCGAARFWVFEWLFLTAGKPSSYKQCVAVRNSSLLPRAMATLLALRPSPQGVDRFDAAAFRLSRAEATALDPQTRLLLQVTQEALVDAGGG